MAGIPKAAHPPTSGIWLIALALTAVLSQFVIFLAGKQDRAHPLVVLGSIAFLSLIAWLGSRVVWRSVIMPLQRAANREAHKAKALVEAAPEAVLGVLPDGRIEFANNQAIKLFGYTRDELVGQKIELLVPVAARDRHVRHRRTYAENPHTRPMGMNMQLVARRQNGEQFPVEVSLSTVQDDELSLVICLVRDVSEQHKAKNEVLLANQQLESTVASLGALNRQIHELGEFGKVLISCRDHEEIRPVIKVFCEKLFPESSGIALLTDASKESMEVVAAWGEGSTTAKSRVLLADCWALRLGVIHMNDQVQCDACQSSGGGSGMQDIQCVPLIGQGEIRGVVRFSKATAGGQETGGACFNRELTTAVADRIALTLANLQLRAALREQAMRDPLTNLYNRRFMTEFMEREMSRTARNQVPLSVLALDLDHFKSLNDSFGHPAGDRVLEAVGQLLRDSIRSGDVACRFGGEEFIVLLPETHLDVAMERAETLRKALERLSVTYAGPLLQPITASIGVAAAPTDGVSVDALLGAADNALYRAKKQGRNRVIAASENRDTGIETLQVSAHDPVAAASR